MAAKRGRPVTNPVVSDYREGPIRFLNSTGGAFARGDIITTSGFDSGSGLVNAVLADADGTATGRDLWVVLGTVANGAIGVAGKVATLTGQNTDASATGNPVWLSPTATTTNTITLTDPTDGDPNAVAMVVGYVGVDSATVGTIEIRIPAGADQVGTDALQDSAVTAPKLGADAVIGAKIPENAIGSHEPAAVVLDHADASPKELLAADASNDRLVFVRAVATEAAAGAPDIDVGSATTDPNGIVDDFEAGAWVVGDRFEGFIHLPATEALDATIAAAGTAGAFNVTILVVTPTVATAQINAAAVTQAKLEEGSTVFVDKQLTNANVLALATGAGIEVIATPGADKAIIVHSVSLVSDDGGGAWTEPSSPDNLVLQYAGGVDITADIVGADLVGGAVVAKKQGVLDTALAPEPNVGVNLFNNGANWGGGNAANTMSLRIWYSVVATIAFS